MAKINPYLNFPGNTEEAFNFYKSVFGGDFAGGIFRFTDTPDSDKLSENDKNKVMHVALPIGNDNLLMATDALESLGFKVIQGNNIHLSLETETKDEAENLFKSLTAGGSVTMPLSDQFWGAYFGSLIDKFGIHWMINYTYPKQN
jgi:PhnB protein